MDRVMEKFHYTEEELPLFRTMHSLAFEFLHLRRNNIMSPKDYYNLASITGTSICFDAFDPFGHPEGMHIGNRMLRIISDSKNRRQSIRESWQKLGESVDWNDLLTFEEKLHEYKFDNNKMDFDDVIVNFVEFGTVPSVQVLFIDEAQDLSIVQWDMATKLSNKALFTYVAGDDDQSIYQWAGADVQKFINLQGKVETLGTSWRVPSSVKSLSNRVVSRINNRRDKQWESLPDRIGDVQYLHDPWAISDYLGEGTWLLLARTNGLLRIYEEICHEVGYFYQYANKNKDFKDIITAVRTWNVLRNEGIATGSRVKILYSLMRPNERVKHGFKSKVASLDNKAILDMQKLKDSYGLLCSDKEWYEALDRINPDDIDYITNALEQDDIDTPRITISTIHGVKGGEAENVVLITDMGSITYDAMQDDPDQEHRVWYVALTRTKNRLFIIEPETQYAYEI
jgi:DNA helicase-2/ATP-dependent DNA helicase PcrA